MASGSINLFTRDQILAISRAVISRESLAKEDIDETAVRIYSMQNFMIQWLFRERLRQAARIINKLKPARLLDFGCGIGILFPYICKTGLKVYATDLRLALAQAFVSAYHLPVHLLAADDWQEAIPDRSLDLIVALDSLEHLSDSEAYISVFRRKLGENGHLVVSGPTENIFYRIGRKVSGIGNTGEYHKRTIADIDRQIKNNGFAIEQKRIVPSLFLPGLFWVLDYVLQGPR